MSLVKINTVAESKAKKPYGMDVKGNAYFPSKGIILKPGVFAHYNEQPVNVQDEAGNWKPSADGRKINLVTAIFDTKEAAFAAVNEDKLLALEAEASITTAAKALGITDEALKAMQSVAF